MTCLESGMSECFSSVLLTITGLELRSICCSLISPQSPGRDGTIDDGQSARGPARVGLRTVPKIRRHTVLTVSGSCLLSYCIHSSQPSVAKQHASPQCVLQSQSIIHHLPAPVQDDLPLKRGLCTRSRSDPSIRPHPREITSAEPRSGAPATLMSPAWRCNVCVFLLVTPTEEMPNSDPIFLSAVAAPGDDPCLTS
jgi:hypothetical protein